MGKPVKGWIVGLGLVCVGMAAQAEIAKVKANNTVNLNVGSSWTGGTVPGVGELAKWDSTVTAENAVLLGANASYSGLWVVNPGGDVFIGGPNTLTIGCQGIRMNTATANLSLTNTTVALRDYVTPVWNVATGRTLSVSPSSNLVRGVKTSLSVQGSGTVTCAALTNNASTGIIGPWARYGTGTSTRYALASGGTIVGYSSGSSVAASGVTDPSGVTNYDVTAAGTVGTGASFNTLRYAGAAGALAGEFRANGLLNAGSGALTLSNSVTVGADKELVLTSPDATRALTLRGAIGDHAEGASGVTVTGGGEVTLSASNAYSGVTVASQGKLIINNHNALGTTNGNTVVFYSGGTAAGGGLVLKGNITVAEPITIYGGELEGGLFAIQNAVSGETNTLAGPITINAFNHTRIAPSSGSVLNINATITSVAGNLVLQPSSGKTFVNAPLNIPGKYLYLHGGPGQVVLTVASNNLGMARIQQQSTLILAATNALVTTADVLVGSETASNTDDNYMSFGTLDLGGGSQTINRLLGYLNNAGAVVPANRLITNSVASPASLTIGSGNGNSVFCGVIRDGAGTVSISKTGTGSLLLAGTNTFSGGMVVSGGSLLLSNVVALQNSTLVCTNSGALLFCGGLVHFTLGGLAGTRDIGLTNASGAAVSLVVGGNTSDTVYSGVLSAGGSLTKVGSGTLTLAGTNTYTGTTSLTNGTLALGCDNALHSASRLVISGGTLNAGTRSNTLQRLVVTGAGTLALGDGSCHLAFADSSEAWTGTLDITGALGPTSLRFGTDASGLTQVQLDSITVGGKKVWLELNDQGYLRRHTGTLIRIF